MDAYTYNTLIACAARTGHTQRALDLLQDMEASGE
jgi:pentatricopeptide repeat protein